ncbi:MAG: acetyl-CoA carboxylase biotin carboxylase subunit [Deltaproteobacteria bacterium]|nr:acetyl-CoA carboxylase biotin carboxylase subunit [Deltaproteobacteria bacterium]
MADLKSIERVLVANRGEIARRVMRTCHEMGISTVAVFSDADEDALHVQDADLAVRIGPAPSSESYLSIDKIIDAARKTGADAVHPGYGFLSENADFADAVVRAGLTFIGPPADVIRAMGDKRRAKELVAEAGVPVIPGYDGADQDPAVLAAEARKLGFPVLLKASAGGGGKGMRVVTAAEGLAEGIAAAKREAAGAFGDDTLLVETYVERPRHVEFQIFGDGRGNVVHLFERECSIQRRHQKVIEETPSAALDDELRARMGEAAVRVARAIGYQNAGTVEFILAPDGAFYFLEVNTRLQVEHPITEMVTGVDLVREQVRVARGEELSFSQESLVMTGAAIECRLYAEDSEAGFLPASGSILDWDLPPAEGVRLDTGVAAGSEVSIHYDPMLAKVIAYGVDRDEAVGRMRRYLSRASVLGAVTNLAFLGRVLAHPDFQAGQYDTHFIEHHRDACCGAAPDRTGQSTRETRWAAIAATLHAHAERAANRPGPAVPSGFRLNDFAPQWALYEASGEELRVEYRAHAGSRFTVDIAGEAGEAKVVSLEGRSLAWEDGEGVVRRARVVRKGDQHHVHVAGTNITLVEVPRFPEPNASVVAGACVAPMPGKIVTVTVAEGDTVEAGQVIVRLEAMKMEHAVKAAAAGTVERVCVAAGEQVDADALLVVIADA